MVRRTWAKLQMERLQAWRQHQQTVHFLHPGKTAGTAMKDALRAAQAESSYRIRLHTHGVRMADLPRVDKFLFVVRDPVDRFVSGFNSRQRQGRPRYERPWSADETRAFARFTSAQALAEGLRGPAADRAEAEDALRSIQHVNTSYWYWFGDEAALRRRWDDVLFVGFLESLSQDLPQLAERLGVERLSLPDDEVAAHRTTPTADRSLTFEARETMAEWYAADYEFVALCRELRADA